MVEHSETLAEIGSNNSRPSTAVSLDTKDWTGWREIFADDFVSDTAGAGGVVITGADAFVAFVRKTLGRSSRPTAHQVPPRDHADVGDRDLGAGTSCVSPSVTMVGYGHYHGPRQDRRPVADHVHADPAARRCCHTAVFGLHLRPGSVTPPCAQVASDRDERLVDHRAGDRGLRPGR